MNKEHTMYEYGTPESVGIDSNNIINFINRLNNQDLAMHSAIIMRHGKICFEGYYKPYTREKLHRMFSITKSFTALAISFLEAEGKLSLDDHIVDFFPEKQPASGPYEYTAMLTIKDMLMMRTCHNATTYKADGVEDWVGSFFTTEPTHVPGTNYSYDTSSTHVLCALVEKLSGMDMLGYLRIKVLDKIDFSKDAHILPDPNGVGMGGSGLCATPLDVLKVMILIANDGKFNGKQLLPEAFIKEAKKKQSDTYAKQGIWEESQGYGYQMWNTRYGGTVLYGMGGQLALYVPDKDIYMMTTADTQTRAGGIQFIYDAFWEEIYHKTDCDVLPANDEATKELEKLADSLALLHITGDVSSPLADKVNGKTYTFSDNVCKVSRLTLNLDNNTGGNITYTNATGEHCIEFKIDDNAYGTFPDYNMLYAASAAWRSENNLLIRVHIIDTAIGTIYINLTYKDDYLTVMFRKVEESLFEEYNGVFSGRCSDK
ncbi:MAG: beta-lactamase family protein [Lachnospira sp.]|nr:beta-lactamase family protein [Lachnospira sp.]